MSTSPCFQQAMPRRALAGLCVAVCLVSAPAVAAPMTYLVTLDAESSVVSADVDIELSAPGNLIGNWHATDNPTGTRTKPGSSGTFGATENVAVPATFTPTIAGMAQSSSSGGWLMTVDTIAGTVGVEGFGVNLLAGGPVALGLNVEVTFGTFRTRSPDSLFFGLTLPIPLGDASLTALGVLQTGDLVAGTLTPVDADTYTFAVVVPVVIAGTGDALGSPFVLEDTPAVVALAGELTLAGDTMVLTASVPVIFAFNGEPTPDGPLTLPPIDVPVPTILPPGSTANLVANLNLTNVDASVDATLSAFGEGVRQTTTTTGACCYQGTCTEVEPEACRPFICDVAANELAECGGPCGTTCYGDVNGDGFVTAADRGFISAAVGQFGFAHVCQFDMDGNGFINAGDRGFVAAEIGLCHDVPDHQNGSGMNNGAPDGRFGQAEFAGAGTTCAANPCAE